MGNGPIGACVYNSDMHCQFHRIRVAMNVDCGHFVVIVDNFVSLQSVLAWSVDLLLVSSILQLFHLSCTAVSDAANVNAFLQIQAST